MGMWILLLTTIVLKSLLGSTFVKTYELILSSSSPLAPGLWRTIQLHMPEISGRQLPHVDMYMSMCMVPCRELGCCATPHTDPIVVVLNSIGHCPMCFHGVRVFTPLTSVCMCQCLLTAVVDVVCRVCARLCVHSVCTDPV